MTFKLATLLAGVAAVCAALSAPLAAEATTVSGTLANGALSTSIAVTANTTLSISMPGSTPIDASTTGKDIGTQCFTVMRSQDGTNFAPLARDATGAFAHYCGPITVDLTETRSGTTYAIQADPGAPSFAYRLDQ